jgi:hypothetical protein
MHLGYLMIAPLSHDSFVRFTEEVLPHLGEIESKHWPKPTKRCGSK